MDVCSVAVAVRRLDRVNARSVLGADLYEAVRSVFVAHVLKYPEGNSTPKR
jgi:hypothetical protein